MESETMSVEQARMNLKDNIDSWHPKIEPSVAIDVLIAAVRAEQRRADDARWVKHMENCPVFMPRLWGGAVAGIVKLDDLTAAIRAAKSDTTKETP